MPETGLNYNYMRDYDPAVGRYIESDPIGLHGGINTYAYADSDPTETSDPSGLSPLLLPLLDKLFNRDDCKVSEWKFCEGKCAPARVLGCYVTVSWKLKGIRGGEPIRSEQRLVNCNCEELDCPATPSPKKANRNVSPTTPPILLPWWARVPIAP